MAIRNPEEYVSIPVAKLPELIKLVYGMSSPAGMGHLQPHHNELDDAAVERILAQGNSFAKVKMDYVNGRQCKMTVFAHPSDPEQALLWPSWYDHSEEQFLTLLNELGVENAEMVIETARITRDARIADEGAD